MPGISLEQPGEVGRVLLAAAGLFLQPGELRRQQRGLELGHPEVGAVADVIEAGVGRGAAVVLEALALLAQAVVIGEDRAPLAGVEVLRGLEAEAAQVAERAELLVPSTRPGAAWQASSITGSLCCAAIARMASMSAAEPPMCTGMMQAVRSVIADSSRRASIWNVSGSVSTKTGSAWWSSTALIVATNV